MLLLVQGVCCLDIVFRHIFLAPLRIKFHRECSAQKINRHSSGAKLWNTLPLALRLTSNLNTFKQNVKSHLQDN